jgi:hypothetical protein
MHLITHLRPLDAYAEGADWREVARIVLKIDPKKDPERAKRAWESHLSRAKWMTRTVIATSYEVVRPIRPKQTLEAAVEAYG